ncbi:MAG: hypothetical protein KIT09_04025 [Bryobacteraceae bacterium]|nr:hypothetical protein [Bryobacteraceae bacterium]
MSAEWIPMRWPAEWTDASRLDLIKGTPINCLTGDAPPVIPLGDIAFTPLDSASPPRGIVLLEGVWPHVKITRTEARNTAETGPTGAPWVDSNGWRTKLARAMEPEKTVWLVYDPPKESEVVPPDYYPLPVAEAEAYGAHWVISLDQNFRKGLESGSDAALGGWKKAIAALEFARKHKEWRAFEPVAALGVVSDFEGENEFMAGEFLNLAARRHLAYRIVPNAKASAASFAGLKAILYVDAEPPQGDLRKDLLAFVEGGGLLIAPQALTKTEPAESKLGYDLRAHGKGRIATPREEWSDPFVLAAEAHLLLSHREDVVRIWNGGTMDSYYAASRDGKKAVVHLVSYSRRGRLDTVTLGLPRPYASAGFYTLESAARVKPVKSRLGTEVPLPPFETYAAIELEG